MKLQLTSQPFDDLAGLGKVSLRIQLLGVEFILLKKLKLLKNHVVGHKLPRSACLVRPRKAI